MIHNDIQNQLALLIKTSAPPLIEVSQSPAESPQWVQGQRLPAYVIASLPNGRFHVLVEDQTLDMNLPKNTQPGETLDLVYVSDKPRPTFALLSDLAKALPTNANNVSLSQTGKFLGSLLQQNIQNSAETPSAALIKGAGAIIPGAPVSVQQLVTALKDTISKSGFFYESHQAQWVTGERSLESLLQEPQAKLAATTVEQKVAVPVTADKNTSDTVAPAQIKNTASESVQTNSVTKLGVDAAGQQQNVAAAGPREPVHPLTSSIVQQQLNILDTRQVIWQGQVWPGQNMEWEIEEDSHRNSGGVDDSEGVWRTRLHLDFPALGGVTAHLALGAGGVKVDFSVEQASSAALLQTEVTSLAQSMESSGLKVAGLAVRQDGGS